MSGNHQKPDADAVGRYLKPALWGIALGSACICVILLLLAGVLSLKDVPLNLVEPLMVAAAAIGSFTGGYFCARKTREKGMLMGMVCAGAIFCILFLCGVLVTGWVFSAILPVKLLSMLLLGAAGGILGVNRKIRHK